MKWKDIKKGDKLYLLVSTMTDEGIKSYKFQESNVITNKKCNGFSSLRLKYTDNSNHRRRVNIVIFDNEKNNILSFNIHGEEIIISKDGINDLSDFIAELALKKQEETKQLLIDYKELIEKK